MERVVLLGFLLVIAAGTLLLWGGNLGAEPLSLLDALFTATSATCVTGLAVVDTGRDLSPFSQVVLLLLIQIGGLGVMTVTTVLPLLLGRHIDLRRRMLLTGGLGLDSPAGAIRLLLSVLRQTLAIEVAGAAALSVAFLLEGHPGGEALWLAVFHSISAYCNAGFSPFATSLEGFVRSPLVPGIVMVLIVLGGLGFPVLKELVERRRVGAPKRLSLYARVVFFTTALLVAGGTALICLTEWRGALGALPWPWKIWNALFCAVTPRTAGFDTISYGTFTGAGLACTMLLMFVGASPASTGGGIKTTTLAVLLLASWREIQGAGEVHAEGRRIPGRTVFRALTLTMLYSGTLVGAVLALSLSESLEFFRVAFEAVSALGTVGLSTGITASLSPFGKGVIILLMFWGRVGIVTFMFGVLARESAGRVSYVDASVPIG